MPYRAVPDPYCYPGSHVLKNKAGLRDQAALDDFETVMSAQRASEPLPAGRLSVTHYRAIHHHLFQDVYPWAGRYRTVRISKGQSMFCYPEHIAREMRALFDQLKVNRHLAGLSAEAFSRHAARTLSTLNAINPFRDGNGRSQLAFMTVLAEHAGYPLNFDRFEPQRFLEAMIKSFNGDERSLASCF